MKPGRLNLNFSPTADALFETKARSICNNMKGNKYFPDPVPALAEVEAATEVYADALVAAAGLGRIKVAEKNHARQYLEGLLVQLGMYVMYVANGDVNILTASGFTLSKTREPQHISNPGTVTLLNGITSGELVSKSRVVKGVRMYLHQVTADPLKEDSQWDGTASSRSTFTFKNLEAGKKYWVRVVALGTGEQIAYGKSVCSNFVQ